MFSQVCDSKVDVLCMSSDHHAKFDIVSDISASVSGAICIVDGNQDRYFAGLQHVLLDKASIYGTACAATIKESFHGQGSGSHDGTEDDFDHEVALHALELVDDLGWFSEFVHLFSYILSFGAEFNEELVGKFDALVPVDPQCKGGTGCVIVSCFVHRLKCPVHLEWWHPLMRGLLSLCTGCRGRGYHRRGHLFLPNAVWDHPLAREWSGQVLQGFRQS